MIIAEKSTGNAPPIIAMNLPETLTIERGHLVFLHRVLHPLLSKQDLLLHFGLSDLRTLRRKVLTDDLLQSAGISPDRYRFISLFDAMESQRLYEALGIIWLRTAQKI